MRKKIIFLSLIFVCLGLGVIYCFGNSEKPNVSFFSSLFIPSFQTEQAKLPDVEVFVKSNIPDHIFEKMQGYSIPTNAPVDLSQLSYLQITYWGFDETSHIGEMVVHKDLAQEVLDIFEEIYDQKYPIEKMKLIDEYEADDQKSMTDNNTSSFCYRVVSNTTKLSNHAFGKAIDINPLYNPYVVGSYVSPANGKQYADRSLVQKGTIQKGDALYNAFIKRGWTWGGNWITQKDYQHFEKKK